MTHLRIRRASKIAPLALLLSLVPSLCAASSARLSGPIEGGSQGAPFNFPTVDLDQVGYVAEEFFLAGTAHAFELATGEHTEDGAWSTRKASTSAPFSTRLLVVRPRDEDRFNGTVVVHWQNVTAGYELGTVSGGEYLRGFAWVGVSAQKIGIHGFDGPDAAGLVQWDPERYGKLSHPGDAYSYDIFTQAARAVGPDRSREGIDPMGGLAVERLVAAGASQSASRLRTYIDGVHQHEKVFAGYIPYIDFASPVPFVADHQERRRRTRTPTRIRADLGVPVLVVNSETETLAYFRARQPETDTYRFWEVAGTSHVSVPREGAAQAEGLDSPNWLSFLPVYDAALRHMHRWLTEGAAPPRFPPIEVRDTGTPEIARDERGNALGGIRLPEMEVPTATHNGSGKPVQGGSRFAFLYGRAEDFSADELARLYPSRDDYMQKYERALAAAVDAGYVLSEEAPSMRAEAERWASRLFTRR